MGLVQLRIWYEKERSTVITWNSIWDNHLSPFLHLKKVGKICITALTSSRFVCSRHAQQRNGGGSAFLKSDWQMTNDAVILYQNAMKIEMALEVHL